MRAEGEQSRVGQARGKGVRPIASEERRVCSGARAAGGGGGADLLELLDLAAAGE